MSEQKIVHVHLPKNEAFKTTLTAGKHELISDEPESVKGGQDAGPDPYDYGTRLLHADDCKNVCRQKGLGTGRSLPGTSAQQTSF